MSKKQGGWAMLTQYLCDQNEPSTPDTGLVYLPVDKGERDAVLIDYYMTEVVQDEEGNPEEYGHGVTVSDKSRWGDIEVGCGGDLYLFATYVTSPVIPAPGS